MKGLKNRMLFAVMSIFFTMAAVALPPLPERMGKETFAQWETFCSQVGENPAKIQLGAGTPKPSVQNGVLTMPVHFSGKKITRASWDLEMPLDLGKASGISFDFYCEDLSQFSSFSCYFRSGNGWYHAPFAPEEEGVWERIQIRKSDTMVEQNGEGWEKISAIRISGWRIGSGETTCAMARMMKEGGTADVLVLRAEKREGKFDRNSFVSYAQSVSLTFEALGIRSFQQADHDVTESMLRGFRLVVLPYNPGLPEQTVRALASFVQRGGKLLVCYALTPSLANLLQLKDVGFIRPDQPYRGFLREGKGLDGQPDFAPQPSWCANRAYPQEGGAVLAYWQMGTGEKSDVPALIRVPAGVFMSHVWLGGTADARAELMGAILGAVLPGFWERSARAFFARIGTFSGVPSWACLSEMAKKGESATAEAAYQKARGCREKASQLMAAGKWRESIPFSEEAIAESLRFWMVQQKGRAGEHRAFWCHSAWGLPDRNWAQTVATMKKAGFNALLPNLCWAGTAFYESRVLPVSPQVQKRGDALKACLAACRKEGVSCHVWKVCWFMGSNATTAFKKQMAQEGRILRNGRGEAQDQWLCPSHPENQRLEIEAMVELAHRGVDGIHFDYIRYPGSDGCFCDGCRARFEKEIGVKVGQWPKEVQTNGKWNPRWSLFRQAQINRVVREVARRVRKETPKVQISAAVFRSPDNDPLSVGQDWSMWCREGWLDFVCPMDYVDSARVFRSLIEGQRKVVGRAKLYPGIGLSCWSDRGDQAVRLARQIQMVREAGLDGFTVFNLDRRADAVFPLLPLGITKTE